MKNIWKVSFAIMLMAAVLIPASCQPGDSEAVLLQGAVTIGPITPVEIPGQEVIVSPEVFAARKIIIYDESGKRQIRDIAITQIGQGATGYYTAQIAPGTYVIDINHAGIDRADGLPVKISPVADETVTIDIDIDTGIR